MDDGIRLAFLKIAEITTHSVPEPLPGNILTLPTPTEAPVSTPRIRISVGSEEGRIGEVWANVRLWVSSDGTSRNTGQSCCQEESPEISNKGFARRRSDCHPQRPEENGMS